MKWKKEIKRLQEQTSQLKRFAPNIHIFLSTHQMNKEIHVEVKSITKALSSVRDYDIEIEIHQGITSLQKDVGYFASVKVDEGTINGQYKDSKIDQAQIKVPTRRSVQNTKLQLRKNITIKQRGREMHILGCGILANGNLLFAGNAGTDVLME
ncbi:unnamed protein product [Mytilus edulis]|uniref:Uncharacterized protein n=1 Tax=Mytilus edulis TaxID=6550 RepID=A0A8S3PV79_MYTED|nr:unnamed protein product [Mytilus edulis]